MNRSYGQCDFPIQGFQYSSDLLRCGAFGMDAVAQRVGTPTYVYSAEAIRENYRSYSRALKGIPHRVHYAVKANSCLAILALLAREGAGFDIVSGGELYRVLKAGGDPREVVYSGVGKTRAELQYALQSGVGTIHCESEPELALLRDVATELGASPAVGIRVNPDIDAKTHPYIATGLSEHKFGVAVEDAEGLYQRASEWSPLRLSSISCHVGSQIRDVAVFTDAVEQLLSLAYRLRDQGLPIDALNLGGGLGIGYATGEPSTSISAYGKLLSRAFEGQDLQIGIEPGRSIVGQAGILLSRVLYRKRSGRKTFLVVDGAMNDLVRPALYQAHHEILPVASRNSRSVRCDVVGPICESGDFLAADRMLPAFEPGDLLAVATAGAYGFVLSSNYNARPRAAEVLIDGTKMRIARRRETLADLIRGEEAWK